MKAKHNESSTMNQIARKGIWLRDEMLHLLSLSGTLSGLCVTGVTLFHTTGKASLQETLADDILAISALMFLLCTYMIFFTLRTKRESLALALEKVVDAIFLLALTGMVISGFIMVYNLL
jgi:multisubunit Na+/H+ antiporter MnhF subunit